MEKKKLWKDDRSMEGRLELRLDPELKSELEQYAEKSHLKLSEVVRAALVDFLKKIRREQKK